jgi:hypothetical protein
VPAAELNGGYVVNGWLQYVRPEQAHRSPEGHIEIPWVNEQLELPYTVANGPRRDATALKTIPYACWLRPSGTAYVLKRSGLNVARNDISAIPSDATAARTRDCTGTVKEVKATTGGGIYYGLLIVLADRAVKQRQRQLAVAVFEAALRPGVHEGFLRQKYA